MSGVNWGYSKNEDEVYRDLTKFQKDLVDSIKNIGFTWRQYGYKYANDESVEIIVNQFHRWSDVLNYFFMEGKRAKTKDIKNMLEIIDPMI